jgi:hypothetical protein
MLEQILLVDGETLSPCFGAGGLSETGKITVSVTKPLTKFILRLGDMQMSANVSLQRKGASVHPGVSMEDTT